MLAVRQEKKISWQTQINTSMLEHMHLFRFIYGFGQKFPSP